MTSQRFTMKAQDWAKWKDNVLFFSSPYLILFLTSLAAGNTIQDSLILLYPVAINAAIDFLKKYVPETQIKK